MGDKYFDTSRKYERVNTGLMASVNTQRVEVIQCYFLRHIVFQSRRESLLFFWAAPRTATLDKSDKKVHDLRTSGRLFSNLIGQVQLKMSTLRTLKTSGLARPESPLFFWSAPRTRTLAKSDEKVHDSRTSGLYAQI